jgi:hypothetical protein
VSVGVVAGAGWHDTYFRWDISTPQRVVKRLEGLPGQGSLSQAGKKLYAERDRSFRRTWEIPARTTSVRRPNSAHVGKTCRRAWR